MQVSALTDSITKLRQSGQDRVASLGSDVEVQQALQPMLALATAADTTLFLRLSTATATAASTGGIVGASAASGSRVAQGEHWPARGQ